MNEIFHQKTINKSVLPVWGNFFPKRECEYLTHIINGLIVHNCDHLDSISIQFGEADQRRILRIFEPFNTLNCLGYWSPSVVSVSFNNQDQIEFYTGNDNGLGIFSSDLMLESVSKFPKNSAFEIDFWHFVDAIGTVDPTAKTPIDAC